MANFDTITKRQAQLYPMDFVNLCFKFKQQDVEFIEIIAPDQPTVEMHQADMLIKVRLNDEDVLVHFEFQTGDSYNPEMSLRMAGYIVRAVEIYRLPVYSSVIYLRPEAGRRDPGYYFQDVGGHQIFIEYQVLRLIEMDGEEILKTQPPGLVLFTPLMGHSEEVSSEEWLRRCVQTADSIDLPNRPAYLGSLVVLSNLVYEPETIAKIILEETMNPPSIVEYLAGDAHQQGIQQGIQQGAKDTAREDVLEALALRLQPEIAERFRLTLDAIEDLQRLKQLHRAAILADTLEDFTKVLHSDTD